MNQLFTNPRYNVGIPLLLLAIFLAITVNWVTYWRMIGLFILSMSISTLQFQWGFYLQGEKTRWHAVGTTLLFMLIATPIVVASAWLGYRVVPALLESVLASTASL